MTMEMMQECEAPLSDADTVAFVNDGLIDPLAIATFGVNVKVSDNPIGFFGTGLKYAIAVLLRHHQDIEIWRGLERIAFGVRRHESRGKEFDIITMNGEPMGFTTELGKKWEMWMALRELWCNCMDEGGEAAQGAYAPAEGKTTIVVRGAEFSKTFSRRSDFLLEGEPVHKLKGVDLHKGPSRTIFYRGVAVGRMPENKEPLHTYNIQGYLDLTEDRTIKYWWQIDQHLSRAFQSSDDAALIEQVVRAPKGTLERELDHEWCSTEKPSEQFIETVSRVRRTHSADMNETAKQVCDKHEPLPAAKSYSLTPMEREQLSKAKTFLLALGYDVETYPVQFFESLGHGVLGSACAGEISISRDAFKQGTKQLAITLLEEFLHLHHDIADETREMQERLLHELVTLGEKHVLGGAI